MNNSSLISTLSSVGNCSGGRRVPTETLAIETVVECLSLLLSLFLMYLFAVKTKFKPRVNVWLFVGCFTLAIWNITKLFQDYGQFPGKCLLTETLAMFLTLFGSFLHLGMCIDRCTSICGKGVHKPMTLKQICMFVGISAAGSMLAALASMAELISGSSHTMDNGYYECVQATSMQALKIKLSFKALVYGLCCLANIIMTGMSIHRIWNVGFKKRKTICLNLFLVSLVTVFVWLTACMFVIVYLIQGTQLCPQIFGKRLYPYLTSIASIIIVAIHIGASKLLRKALRITKSDKSEDSTQKVTTPFSLSSFCHHLYVEE